MCVMCYVTDKERNQIIAYNAAFHKVTSSPYGSDDQIGMLNVISPESRSAILSNADPTRVFDLAVDHFIGMPGYFPAGDPTYQIWMTHTPDGEKIDDSQRIGKAANELLSYSGDAVSMYTHCGTHIDTLSHFGYEGKIFNGFNVAENLGSRHWNKCGPEHHPPIFARGVLLDIAAMLGVDTLRPSYGIGEKDLRACLTHQNMKLRLGDVVLIRTGQMRLWPDKAYVDRTPGLNREGAEFLAKNGAMMIGADNLCVEQVPAVSTDNPQPVHSYLLAEAGIPLIEMVNLEELSQEKIFEFVFFGACIKFKGATGAPIRPVAMPLRY